MTKSTRSIAALLFLLTVSVSTLLHGTEYSFRRVVDSSTTVPGTGNPFGNIDIPNIWGPSISGSNTAFFWFGAGHFLDENGSLNALVGEGAIFGEFSLSGSSLVTGGTSVVRETNGVLTTLVDASTDLPGVMDATSAFFGTTPGVSGNNVVFTATDNSAGDSGVYTHINGTIELVAETGMFTPGKGAYFGQVSQELLLGDGPAISGTNTAFVGYDNTVPSHEGFSGIFTSINGTLSLVARTDETYSLIRGPLSTFSAFAYPSMWGTDLAFLGATGDYGIDDISNSPGVYTYIDETFGQVANTYADVPGGGGVKFGEFGQLSFVNGQTAFLGIDTNGNSGVYLGSPGEIVNSPGPGPPTFVHNIEAIVEAGDLLDGRIVSDLGFSRSGYDGSQIAFAAEFTDGTAGIYVASLASSTSAANSIPEPSTLTLAGLAFLMLIRRRRRHA